MWVKIVSLKNLVHSKGFQLLPSIRVKRLAGVFSLYSPNFFTMLSKTVLVSQFAPATYCLFDAGVLLLTNALDCSTFSTIHIVGFQLTSDLVYMFCVIGGVFNYSLKPHHQILSKPTKGNLSQNVFQKNKKPHQLRQGFPI